MSDQESSGAPSAAPREPVPAPAPSAPAPTAEISASSPAAADSTVPFGAFGTTRGSGLARGKRTTPSVVAFTKTEAAQVALYALLFLGETPTVKLVGAIVLATVGVFLMAGSGAETARAGWR